MALIPKELLADVKRLHIVSKRRVQEALAGAYHSVFKGQGIEFEDVRFYQPGDDIRSIDWNVTARMQFPHIKRFREERELTVMLLVDISGSVDFGSDEKTKRQRMAEVGALLSLAAMENGDRVGLLLFTDEVELYLPPRKGIRHALRVIREVMVAKGSSRGTDVAAALDYLGRVQKRQAICFLLSDFMTPSFSKAVAAAARRYDLIALHLLDPCERELPDLGLLRLRDLETARELVVDSSDPALRQHMRQQAEERAQKVSDEMERVGAGYVTLQRGESAVDSLHRYFTLRSRRT